VYGPLATGTEWAASALSSGSATSTVFWLKVWNALAFLAAALALGRLAGADRARRARVHLLWPLNPLMLDWVQLARTLVATIGCLPGLAVRFGDSWLRTGPLPYVVPGALLLLVLVLAGGAALRPRSGPVYPAAASSPAS
jgi:hypothetical protein